MTDRKKNIETLKVQRCIQTKWNWVKTTLQIRKSKKDTRKLTLKQKI